MIYDTDLTNIKWCALYYILVIINMNKNIDKPEFHSYLMSEAV